MVARINNYDNEPCSSAKIQKEGFTMSNVANKTTPWLEGIIGNYHWIDEHLQKQPGTTKEFQPAWQAYKYLLYGKMYTYVGTNDKNGRPIITMKLEPAFSDMMRQKYDDIIPGYYMNKQHWSTVYLDGETPQQVIADMMCASYKVMFSSLSKKAQQEIEVLIKQDVPN
jgi:predicted DNA-binding protein (MmcQ/YjbR family)